jgi:4a-hydroxytetrahydrobiopterin dehydratase
MSLSQQTCEPCKNYVPPLTLEKVSELGKQLHPDWKTTENTRLTRTIKCKDFMAGVALINQIAQIAEAQGHHPNLRLYDYKFLEIQLYTHKIGGLHQNDFILAAKIDETL